MQVGKQSLTLGLHQPIYRNLDNQPAKILKFLNMIAAVLLLIGGLFRLAYSFEGAVVVPTCNQRSFNKDFCDGEKDCQVEDEEKGVELDCKAMMKYMSVPNDGFMDTIVSVYIIFFAVVNLVEEIKSEKVEWFMKPLGFMGNLSGRGLYYLFVSSLVLSNSHTPLAVFGGIVMGIAFIYLIVYAVCRFTTYGDRLGVHGYQQQADAPASASASATPAPGHNPPVSSVV